MAESLIAADPQKAPPQKGDSFKVDRQQTDEGRRLRSKAWRG